MGLESELLFMQTCFKIESMNQIKTLLFFLLLTIYFYFNPFGSKIFQFLEKNYIILITLMRVIQID